VSERTDSQIIHEARGLCWHEWVWYPREKNSPNRKCYCRVCDEQAKGIHIKRELQLRTSSPPRGNYKATLSYTSSYIEGRER
jgi:hypothetical protein